MQGYSEVVEAVRRGVDVIAAGFPCQDESMAGQRKGIQFDESTQYAETRSGLWGALLRAIRLVLPRYALLENVAGLLSGSMGRVQGDLAEIGYDSEWDCISAASIGAEHMRDRVWIIAYSDPSQLEGGGLSKRIQEEHANFGNTRWGKDKPGVDRVSDGNPAELVRLEQHGNSIVPQIPEIIGRAILEASCTKNG